MAEVVTYVTPAPNDRNPAHHHALEHNLEALLNDHHLIHLRLPPQDALQISVKIRNGLNMLQCLDNSTTIRDHLTTEPSTVGLWESLPGGGRRRVLDTELIQLMSSEGTYDKVIASFFKVSRRTILRRRKEAGIEKNNWTPLSVDTLREVSQQCVPADLSALHLSCTMDQGMRGRKEFSLVWRHLA